MIVPDVYFYCIKLLVLIFSVRCTFVIKTIKIFYQSESYRDWCSAPKMLSHSVAKY